MKSKKIQISLKEGVLKMLKEMAKQDFIENQNSMFIDRLIIEETKRRISKGEMVEMIDEDLDLVPHPDQVMNKGKMITKEERDLYLSI